MNISMKKIALGLLSLFLVVGSINAQEGKKALKKAGKLLSAYGKVASGNEDKLTEGLALLNTALQSEEVSGNAKNMIMVADAYNAVADGQIKSKILNPTYELGNVDLAMKAFETYSKAYDIAEKKGDKKKALAGLRTNEDHLNNIGIYFFQESKYAEAFDFFNKCIDAYKYISEKGGNSRLDDEVERKEHYFYTGAAGYYGKKGMTAAPVLMEIAEQGTDKALIYEALYNILATEDNAKAVSYLEKGRELFPDDTGLLFAEINYYLTEGKLDILTDKLKSALEKEPDNVSLYTTLGNVYDQLNQTERDAGNIEKADEYFNDAMTYYNGALKKDPTNFDAVYSQGALYYNKAASLTGKINELANDFSAAGTKKYDALKKEMDGFFGQALPFFVKAEGMNGKDLNTLIALREIYARQSLMDKVGEYKTKIEAAKAGN